LSEGKEEPVIKTFVKVSDVGSIVIPKEVRDLFTIKSGETLILRALGKSEAWVITLAKE